MSSDKDVIHVAIDESKLRELMRNSILLESLRMNGVDAWDGYSYAKKCADKEFKNWENENGWR